MLSRITIFLAFVFLALAFLAACTTGAQDAGEPVVTASSAMKANTAAMPTPTTSAVTAPPTPAVLPSTPVTQQPPLSKAASTQAVALDEQTRLARQAAFVEAMAMVEARQRVFSSEAISPDASFTLTGNATQAGMMFGQTVPGATVRLDGKDVMVGPEGRFVIGFGRDSALTALLTVQTPDGAIHRHTIELSDRTFKEERIDGLDQSKVSGYTGEQLKKIRADQALKKVARSETHDDALWADGFDWPVTGRISGVFGSRRILNGEPKRPHSGVDVARPTGTPIRAPAAGIIRLAETGMYFEGGLVLLDHGHWVESAFLHMSRIDVEPGQRVEKGEVIGAIGATGRVTGPHLHWSVRWLAFNRLVDPQLLAGDMPSGK